MSELHATSLDELCAAVQACHKCELCEGRTQVVFGAGSACARVLIIGEAPGKNEDEQGKPFVGKAGKSLSELLALAHFSRDEVYIANVLKCRPPNNRNPKVDEILACAPFLREQTRLISPEVIVTLGNFATRFILKTEEGITHLHGQVFERGRFKVVPMYHPAAAIYDRSKIGALRQDFTSLGVLLGASGESTESDKSAENAT